MFYHISENWRGRPLESLEAVVNLIGDTSTSTGLRIEAELDERTYEEGIKVSDTAFAELNIRRDRFHGDWNYELRPWPI
jgi:hypothetical protein